MLSVLYSVKYGDTYPNTYAWSCIPVWTSSCHSTTDCFNIQSMRLWPELCFSGMALSCTAPLEAQNSFLWKHKEPLRVHPPSHRCGVDSTSSSPPRPLQCLREMALHTCWGLLPCGRRAPCAQGGTRLGLLLCCEAGAQRGSFSASFVLLHNHAGAGHNLIQCPSIASWQES